MAVFIYMSHLKMLGFTESRVYFFKSGAFIAVAVFMFLSGYGVCFNLENKGGYSRNFLKRRLPQILIPFVVIHAIYIPVKLLFGFSFTVKDVFLSFLGQGVVADNCWFPVQIIVLYMATYIVIRIFNGGLRKKWIVLSIAVITISAVQACYQSDMEWWYISNFAYALGGFVYFYRKKIFRLKLIPTLIGLSIMLIAGIYIIPVWHIIFGYYSDFAYMLSYNVVSSIGAMAIVFVAVKYGRKNRITNYLGNISYEFYLIHGLFQACFHSEALYIGNSAFYILLTFVLSVLFAYMIKNVDEYLLAIMNSKR